MASSMGVTVVWRNSQEMGEPDGLEANGDFLIYSWPEKALWFSVSNITSAH